MTIRRRLARSNLVMILIPVAIAAVLLLLGGVARDEAARTRYLQTICAKESELEALVNRLFSFAKLDLDEAPADLVPLDIAGTLQRIVDSCDAEALDVRLGELPEGRVLADRKLLTRTGGS